MLGSLAFSVGFFRIIVVFVRRFFFFFPSSCRVCVGFVAVVWCMGCVVFRWSLGGWGWWVQREIFELGLSQAGCRLRGGGRRCPCVLLSGWVGLSVEPLTACAQVGVAVRVACETWPYSIIISGSLGRPGGATQSPCAHIVHFVQFASCRGGRGRWEQWSGCGRMVDGWKERRSVCRRVGCRGRRRSVCHCW